MMFSAIGDITYDTQTQKLVRELYEAYASRLLSYSRRFYRLPEDDAVNLVYKTIYRIAEVNDRYSFENEKKRRSFVFKTYLNFLRNYYRDNKSFESKNFKVDLHEFASTDDVPVNDNPKVKLLQHLLDRMEDWERTLLLMRGQDIPYSQISPFVHKPEKQLKVYYARLKKKLLDDMNKSLNQNKGEKQ
jgi:RNA polymerase sigma factor (sigma-70 family)